MTIEEMKRKQIKRGTPLRRQVVISLEEDEWRRFVDQHPEPVQWIVDQIKSSLDSPGKESHPH